jgi:hypothetical protein
MAMCAFRNGMGFCGVMRSPAPRSDRLQRDGEVEAGPSTVSIIIDIILTCRQK